MIDRSHDESHDRSHDGSHGAFLLVHLNMQLALFATEGLYHNNNYK